MSKHPKPIRVKRSESEIRSLLKAQAESKVNVNDFCKIHQLSRPMFYNWRNKYPLDDKLPVFVPVQLPVDGSASALFAEIEFPQNKILRLFRPVDPIYLKALIKL